MKPLSFLSKPLNITHIQVFPLRGTLGKSRAIIKIILNHSIVITSIKLLYGDYGYYLSMPHSKEKIFDKFIIGFKPHQLNELKQNILTIYQKKQNSC